MSEEKKMELKNEILLRIQKKFPLVQKPFLEIAKELNIEEQTILDILQEEKSAGIIRQTSAIFDTRSLGYKSSLVAFKIASENIDEAVKILNAHPGISHNYERNHDFNIWFTIAVPPNSILGLEKSIEILAKKTNADDFIILPTLKLFKIAVKLDTTNKEDQQEKVVKKSFKPMVLTDYHYSIIKLLQKDISFESEPFKFIVDELNITYEELFSVANEFLEAGVMRRFASILNHRKAGFNANAMVVWEIDEERAKEFGEIVASFSAVSHCYLRPQYPNWKYNLFTMIHSKTKEETTAIIDAIGEKIEFKQNLALYSSREFKKVRIVYFSDEFKIWEEQNKE